MSDMLRDHILHITARRAPLVLFLPGYSLIAALFPGKDDLDGIERIALSFWAWVSQSCRCSGWHSITRRSGSGLLPVLAVLSMFTILLAMLAGVRQGLPEGKRFVVEGGMGAGAEGRGGSGSDGGRGGGLA